MQHFAWMDYVTPIYIIYSPILDLFKSQEESVDPIKNENLFTGTVTYNKISVIFSNGFCLPFV